MNFKHLVLTLCLTGIITIAHAADSVVTFNEIMYHPAGETDSTMEWVELHNQMAIDIDISGWSVKGGIKYTFAEGTIVPGGGYLVLAKSPASFEAASGYSGALGPYDGLLSNSGERIKLVNNADRLMDEVEYNDRGDWPVAPDGSGVSLAKKAADRSSEKPQNWISSGVVGGTPGSQNFSSLDPVPELSVAFNEVAAYGPGTFWVELVNNGSAPFNLNNAVIAINGQVYDEYVFDSQNLLPGHFISINATELGFAPDDKDTLFLYDPSGSEVLDAVVVKNRCIGRTEPMGDWYYPASESPGSANVFDFKTDIVINELMYHKGDIPAVEGEYDDITLVSAGAEAWTLAPQDDSLGTDWTGGNEPFDDSEWTDGLGSTTGIGYERGTGYAGDIGTDIESELYGNQTSFYVRVPFTLATAPSADTMSLAMKYDDGFVAYLNGVEIARRNAPTELSWNEPASGSHEANGYEQIDVTSFLHLLKAGTNILAFHGFNVKSDSSDLLILPELSVFTEITAPIPGGESPEEWVELYNKGAAPVDLTGWKFDSGIDFEFAAGTTINPGEYLVVAKDAALMAQQYPSITVVGDYDGNLSNEGELVELIDASGNPADSVRYYDDNPWSVEADGANASLELRDPDADNSNPQAWAASDETDRSQWKTYTYRGVAQPSVKASAADGDGWHEFVIGMLDAGEILLDDISVVEDPDGTATEFIQNSSFESGTPEKWRLLGTQRHSEVIDDPDNPGNKVLRLVATGTTEHLHNHLETTLAGGNTVVNGREYEISFKAKWVSGSNQFHSRLYFNRLAKKTLIEKPELNGTPGAQNSRYESNIGPTLSDLNHYPAVPEVSEPVTVSIEADDPDGIHSLILYWRVDGQFWNQTSMLPGGGTYEGMIPAHPAATIIQFYVRARDTMGRVSMFPPKGPDSNALYRVQDGRTATNGLHNFRIIQTQENDTWMHQNYNVMSNDRIGATVIYDESRIYYDVGVRTKGSEHHRYKSNEVGFNVLFHADQLFRGTHKTVAIDRSQGNGFGQREMLVYQAANHAGVVATKYHDLIRVIPNRTEHTSTAELQLARYNDQFLEDSFENGSDGTLYEFELIYRSENTVWVNGDYYKIPGSDGGTSRTSVTDLGSDKEDYRWFYLLKNNRSDDPYDDIMNFASSFSDTSNLGNLIDLDVWLSSFAIVVASGVSDNYGSGSQHNAMFYVRPSDGKVLFFAHDMDLGFSVTRSITSSGDLTRMLTVPANERLFYGHLYNILTSSYNLGYMTHIANNFGQLAPEQPFATSHLSYIGQRSDWLLGQIASKFAPQYPFAITDPNNMVVEEAYAQVHGTAWLDMKELYLDGRDEPLELSWTSTGSGTTKKFSFTANIPLEPGVNTLTFRAYDFRKQLIGTHTMMVTSTATERPLRDYLRVTEIMYDPLGGSDYEFIELQNTSGQTMDVTDVTFTDGITFAFAGSDKTELLPGEYVLVVKDQAEFSSRYDTTGMNIAGEYSGSLSNSGEEITLQGKWASRILSITYDDKRGWPLAADGAGHSLVPVYSHIEAQSDGSGDFGPNWRPSGYIHGSPGAEDIKPATTVQLNEFCAHTDYFVGPHESNDWIELYNASGSTVTLNSDWYLSDDGDDLKKYALPSTPLSSGGYASFDQITHFNPDGIGLEGWGLNKAGDEIYLSYLPGTDLDRVVDCIKFKGQPNGFSLSRYPDGGDFWYQTDLTRDLTNASPDPICVISEFLFHPGAGDKEFIELRNLTSSPLSLWDGAAHVQAGWRLDGGVSFDFRPSDTIAAEGFLVVVGFDPNESNLAAFNNRHGTSLTAGQVVGPYSGDLSNNTERIALERPQASDDLLQPDDLSWIIVDEVIYFDQAPWPYGADGTGQSLQRNEMTVSGNDPENWQTHTPSPGCWISRADFNRDGQVTMEDFAYLAGYWQQSDCSFINNDKCDGVDLNDSGQVDIVDLGLFAEWWLQDPATAGN